MTIYQLLTVRDAAKLGVLLAKLAATGDKEVTIDFGVESHCFFAAESLTPSEYESLGNLDLGTFENFKPEDIDTVFNKMEEIVKHPIADYGRSFFFEGFSVYEKPDNTAVVVNLRWGS